MTIADEVDSQLTHAMDRQMNVVWTPEQHSYSAAIKRGKDKDNEGEDMDSGYQYGQTSGPSVWP